MRKSRLLAIIGIMMFVVTIMMSFVYQKDTGKEQCSLCGSDQTYEVCDCEPIKEIGKAPSTISTSLFFLGIIFVLSSIYFGAREEGDL